MEKLGLFGGTFAPFHNGHANALRALAKLGLDRIVLVPTYLPPHKAVRADDDPRIRLSMLRGLCRTKEFAPMHLGVSDFEIRQGGMSYSYHTLRHFTKKGRKLYFLVGTDMFLTLENWYRGSELFSLAEMVCVLRGEEEDEKARVRKKAEEYRLKYGASCTFCEAEPLPLSSTGIREAVAAGERISELVPAYIEERIRKEGLYLET